MDLVALQNNAKQIRNPFGFDFVVRWDKKPIVLKGDGQWKTVIAPLRDHIANHLYQKIWNQYHDEKVNALKTLGKDKEARKFAVPLAVSDKIWFMITGEHKYTNHNELETPEDAADLTELKNAINKMDQAAIGNPENISVTNLIDAANTEALASVDTEHNDSAHVAGGATFSPDPAPVDPVTAALSTPPADTVPVDPAVPATPAAPAANNEFAGLQDLK